MGWVGGWMGEWVGECVGGGWDGGGGIYLPTTAANYPIVGRAQRYSSMRRFWRARGADHKAPAIPRTHITTLGAVRTVHDIRKPDPTQRDFMRGYNYDDDNLCMYLLKRFVDALAAGHCC